MEKSRAIPNIYDTSVDVYQRKYIKYFSEDLTDKASISVFKALMTKDIVTIEDCLKDLSNTLNNFTLLVGLCCHIIEEERLYENTEFGVSYLRYAKHLFDDLNISTSTLSASKIMVENYKAYFKPLKKAGFKLMRNSNKLLHLSEALENHQEEEVYTRIVEDTYSNFRDWALRKNIAKSHQPEPDVRVDAEIKGDKLLIDGKNILNFPKGLPKDMKEMIKKDLQTLFSIREGGNLPYIVNTYGKGEQSAINNFLKQYRSSK